jgi:phosphoribosyl-ATP pyrophosphohydrolase
MNEATGDCQKCDMRHECGEIPPECNLGDYTIRPEVAAFALLMERKLRKNDGKKPGWIGADIDDLLEGIHEEYGELHAALFELSPEEVHREAADLGNYAMMTADVVKRLSLPAGVVALRIREVRR